jgi:20S proteasome subunit alpha 6
LFEFSPAGTAFEYYAHSIGARSQSAKTYLEKNFESFEDGTCLLQLISILLQLCVLLDA